MVVSDVLQTKGHAVVRIRPTDSIELAVRKLAEHRIGALVVEDLWMKPVGIFSERDFINAVARDGAAVLGFQVQQLMTTPFFSCLPSDRVDAMLARMTLADPSPAGYRGQRVEGHRQYRRSGEASPRREGAGGECSS